jgi:hypothetical protein
MNADEPTPRVGFAQLKNMIGRKVLFVGRVEQMENGVARMAAPDGSKVSVQSTSMFETPYAEVQGVVVDPQTIREESHVNFGENFGGSCLRGDRLGPVALAKGGNGGCSTQGHRCF